MDRLCKKGSHRQILFDMTRLSQGIDLVAAPCIKMTNRSNHQLSRNDAIPDVKCVPIPSIKDRCLKRLTFTIVCLKLIRFYLS